MSQGESGRPDDTCEYSPVITMDCGRDRLLDIHGNREFWRVLLGVLGIPFVIVEPRVWQKAIFLGISGTKPKRRAQLFIEQRYPRIDLSAFGNAETREGIRDAMCLALWARTTSQ